MLNSKELEKLKAKNYLIEGVNIFNVLAVKLYDASKLKMLKRAIFALFWKPILVESSNGTGVLIFHGCKMKRRDDYDDMLSTLKGKLSQESDYVEVLERFSFVYMFKACFHFFKNLKIYPELGVLKSIYIHILYVQFSFIKDEVSNIFGEKKHVITFCDAHPYDNLCAQLASKKNIKTYTIQHGQYRELSTDFNPDVEVYKNFISDKLLCWGDKTKLEFMRLGVDESRLVVTGRFQRQSRGPEFEASLRLCTKHAVGVLFSGDNEVINKEMLKIIVQAASSLNLMIVLRLHPYDSICNYHNELKGLNYKLEQGEFSGFVNSVDFCICHMTAAFLDVLKLGKVCFIYKDETLSSIFHNRELNFENSEDLISISSLKNSKNIKCIYKEYVSTLANVINLEGL